ncbi:hypothetical protein [Limnoglobus roseus]|uniref:Uncharacterized protein n=1 Tax=Limnoglobus roseus TaxID=2598579 RepID=A0A5C1AI11_9BACT|nr:hypothetical protein [Limnoglobus roseus]QEL19069.1 hypothetical protein PX52LOC_06126 [Limnoglobus roseus]
MLSFFISPFVAPLFNPGSPATSAKPSKSLRDRLAVAVADLLELMSQGYSFADAEVGRDRVASVLRLAVRLIRLGRVRLAEENRLAPALPPKPLWERLTDSASTIEVILEGGEFTDADFDADGVAALEVLAKSLWQTLEDHLAAVPTPDEREEIGFLAYAPDTAVED